MKKKKTSINSLNKETLNSNQIVECLTLPIQDDVTGNDNMQSSGYPLSGRCFDCLWGPQKSFTLSSLLFFFFGLNSGDLFLKMGFKQAKKIPAWMSKLKSIPKKSHILTSSRQVQDL